MPPPSIAIFNHALTQESVITIHRDALSVYEFHPLNQNLYQTVKCFPAPGILHAAGIPTTNYIAYRNWKQLVIFDLTTASVLCKLSFEWHISDFVFSTNAVVIKVHTHTDHLFLLYSWNGSRIKFAGELSTEDLLVVSGGPQFALLDRQEKRMIRFLLPTSLEEDDGKSINPENCGSHSAPNSGPKTINCGTKTQIHASTSNS